MHVENLLAGFNRNPQKGSYLQSKLPPQADPPFNQDLEKKFVPNLSLCGCDSIFTL
jgi:hypothetical protein